MFLGIQYIFVTLQVVPLLDSLLPAAARKSLVMTQRKDLERKFGEEETGDKRRPAEVH